MDTAEQAFAPDGVSGGAVYPALLPVEALEQGFILAPGELGSTAMRVGSSAETFFAGEQNRQGVLIGEIGLMIRFEEGSELTDIPPIYHLPNVPSWMLGVVNLHGRLIPVFDLLGFLSIARSAPEKRAGRGSVAQRLLVLGHDADAAAFIIDGLPQRIHWTNEMRTEADLAPPLLEPHVRTSCLVDGKVWFDLDSASLFNAFEQILNAS